MTATTLSHRGPRRARGGYGFRAVARMEWQKLRTIRSTWYLVALFAAGMIGLAVLVLSQENDAPVSAAGRAAFDPTYRSFLGLVLGQFLLGTLGVLAITNEFSSGMIRATFAAAPRRPSRMRPTHRHKSVGLWWRTTSDFPRLGPNNVGPRAQVRKSG